MIMQEIKYKLVPVEPSQEMLDEAAEGLYGCSRARAIEIAKEEKFDSYVCDAEKVWSAMLGLCETTLSDLEIVQKALEKSKSDLSFYLGGNWSVFVCDSSSYGPDMTGNGSEALLTWAKQTIGIEDENTF